MHDVSRSGCTLGGITTCSCIPSQKLNIISLVAFLIIGCVAAAGLLSGSVTGWTAVGLGLGLFALNMARGNLHQRRIDVITEALFTAAIIVIGTLGGLGILSAAQMGGGLIAVVLAPKLINCVRSKCYTADLSSRKA